MCFSSPKLPKAKPAVKMEPISQPPITQELPKTQSGADIQNTKKKPRVKSQFQIDLSSPLEAGVGASTSALSGSGVGPSA